MLRFGLFIGRLPILLKFTFLAEILLSLSPLWRFAIGHIQHTNVSGKKITLSA